MQGQRNLLIMSVLLCFVGCGPDDAAQSEVVASCEDGIKNQDEEGIDCGGVCAACVVAATCEDGIKNQDEEAVDCGGRCVACPQVLATCEDGIKNQDEEGIDCGGVCKPCAQDATCEDGIKNQDEEGIDCGGVCAACVAAATCEDGIKNQDEEEIDCGGGCAPCERSLKLASAGLGHCVLGEQGRLWCWGSSMITGQRDTMDRRVPTIVEGLPALAQVEAGDDSVCVVDQLNDVWCWGSNLGGEITNELRQVYIKQPYKLSLSSQGRVVPGGSQSCQLTPAGEVRCWGRNICGELGPVSASNALHVSPTKFDELSDVSDISLGQSYGCALSRAGEVRCWGAVSMRDCPVNADQRVSTLVDLPMSAKLIKAHKQRACALLGDGAVYCWSQTAPTPVLIDLPYDVVKLDVGAHHACALTSSEQVVCWGENTSGQLGVGNALNPRPNDAPKPVLNLDGVVDISVASVSSCALTKAGEVWCWGSNQSGALGVDMDPRDHVSRPIKLNF